MLGILRGQAPFHPCHHGPKDGFIAGLFDDDVPALRDDVQLLVGRRGALVELPGAVYIAEGVVFAMKDYLPTNPPCSLASEGMWGLFTPETDTRLPAGTLLPLPRRLAHVSYVPDASPGQQLLQECRLCVSTC